MADQIAEKSLTNATVAGRKTGDEDERVDKMDSALPTGVLNGNRHWALDSTRTTVYQFIRISGAG